MRTHLTIWLAVASACSFAGAAEQTATQQDLKPTEQLAGIQGVVSFRGRPPQRRRIRMLEKNGKLSDCHVLHENGLLNEDLLVSETGGLANVFVYVKKGLNGREFTAPEEAAILNQEGCMFRPRIQGLMVGQNLTMKNGDPVLHNVRALSFRNRPFNVAQPAESPDRVKSFRRAEREVMIQCDLHPWMKAYVFVMEHPYFAVSDVRGRFQIADLSPGEYTIEAWHEVLGKQKIEVEVDTDAFETVSFVFESKTRADEPSHQLETSVTNSIIPSAEEVVAQRSFVKMWQTEDLAAEAEFPAARSFDDGRKLFETAGCIKCHVIAGQGAKFGPELTDVAKRFKGAKLLDQIINPSREIHKDFNTWMVLTAEGKVISGLAVREDDTELHLLPNPLKPTEMTVVKKSTIEERKKSNVSMMPKGLLSTFTKDEILNLLAFVQAGGKRN